MRERPLPRGLGWASASRSLVTFDGAGNGAGAER
jgi:hypothetical protein